VKFYFKLFLEKYCFCYKSARFNDLKLQCKTTFIQQQENRQNWFRDMFLLFSWTYRDNWNHSYNFVYCL